jgi:hypothetical protein
MRVQRVLAPDSIAESWTLLGDDLRPVGCESEGRVLLGGVSFQAVASSVPEPAARRDRHGRRLTP